MFYHWGMEHLEIHIITTEYSAELALEAGLLEEDDVDLTCEHCDKALGTTEPDYEFTQFCIAMTHEEVWFVCLDCSAPLVYPAN